MNSLDCNNKSSDRPKVSIVIPVFNEEDSIGDVLSKVAQVVEKEPGQYEVIVVNDHSIDRTQSIVEEFVNSHKMILTMNRNSQGKGGSLRTGFDMARGDYFVMMDGDGSHQAVDIPKLVQEVLKTNGLAIGSRIYGGSEEFTRVRAFGNLLFTWLFGMFHGRYLSDALNGFKAFHLDVYKSFSYSSKGYEIEIELLVNTLKLKRPITEIPSLELRRQGGEAKSRILKDGFKFLWRIIYEWLKTKLVKTKQLPSR